MTDRDSHIMHSEDIYQISMPKNGQKCIIGKTTFELYFRAFT